MPHFEIELARLRWLAALARRWPILAVSFPYARPVGLGRDLGYRGVQLATLLR